jgi:hypothetical protein
MFEYQYFLKNIARLICDCVFLKFKIKIEIKVTKTIFKFKSDSYLETKSVVIALENLLMQKICHRSRGRRLAPGSISFGLSVLSWWRGAR